MRGTPDRFWWFMIGFVITAQVLAISAIVYVAQHFIRKFW